MTNITDITALRPSTLAAADFAGLFQNIGLPLLGLVMVVVIGWVAIVKIRGWMRGNADNAKPFSLDDLRRLRREGMLSEEEFEKARSMMLASVGGVAGGAKRGATDGATDGAAAGTNSAKRVSTHPTKPLPIEPSTLTPPLSAPVKPTPPAQLSTDPSVGADGTRPLKSPKRPSQLD
jgi:hypothetical protein